jgi:hypothetical protein
MLSFSTISTVFTVTVLDLGLGVLIGATSNYIFSQFIYTTSPSFTRLIFEIVSQALFSMIALAEATTFFSNVYANESVSGLMLFFIAFIVQVGFVERLQTLSGCLQAWIALRINAPQGGEE